MRKRKTKKEKISRPKDKVQKELHQEPKNKNKTYLTLSESQQQVL